MGVKYINCVTRGGRRFSLNMSQFSKIEFIDGIIPKLVFQNTQNEMTMLFSGAKFPLAAYDPRYDLVHVTLIYEDGNSKNPFSEGPINFFKLYQLLYTAA